MSHRRTVYVTAGIAAVLLVLRVAMLPRVAAWAAEERVLSLPQRITAALAEGAFYLIVPLLIVAGFALYRGYTARPGG